MFRFADPIYLYLLVLIPVLALLRYILMRRRRKLLQRFGDIELVRLLAPDVSHWRPMVKFSLLLTALTLVILMLARPQMGTKVSREKRTGIEIIIAMDISNSMLAEDVAPSRLERSKMMVESLVDKFTNDKVGLIVFAGDAFVQLPITSDFISAKMFLNSIEPSLIETQGTDIAAAITMATHSFTQQEEVGKAIIVITDGENHEGGAEEAAKDAKGKGMNVFVLGVGSTKGSPIPVAGSSGYMHDRSGQTVLSALNESMCKQIAEAGGGAYIHVENNSRAQEQLNAELDNLSKQEIASTIYSDYDEQFQAVTLIIILLLIVEACMMEIKNANFRKLNLFNKKASAIIALLLLPMVAAYAQSDRDLVRSGNAKFQKGNFADAEIDYRKAIEKNARNSQAVYNLGNALFAQRKDSAAIVSFQSASKMESNPIRRAMSFHNIGVICQGRQLYGEAIEAYKEALRNNPKDDETRYNLELCKRQQKQQQNKNQNQNKNKEKNQQDKQEKQEKKDKEDKQQDKQQQQMSKENAEQLLNAAMQEEKKTQERLKKEQRKQQKSRQLEKNW